LRAIERSLVEDREDARRAGLVEPPGRDCRDRDERVAAVQKGELIGEADHDPLRSGAVRDVPPQILARLQPLEPERFEHVEGSVRSGFARLHLRLEGFQRERRSWKGGNRKDARSRQRKRYGQPLHFTPNFTLDSCAQNAPAPSRVPLGAVQQANGGPWRSIRKRLMLWTRP